MSHIDRINDCSAEEVKSGGPTEKVSAPLFIGLHELYFFGAATSTRRFPAEGFVFKLS